MSYFKPFPLVLYPTSEDSSVLEWQVNITRRTGVPQKYKRDQRYYYEHVVREGETPEILADKLYDNINYAWVILQFNDIVDLYKEWPMNSEELRQYANAKYENPYEIKHYVSISRKGLIVEEDHPLYDRRPVTYMEYEEEENDKKRNIKLPTQEIVSEIVKSHSKLMRK